MPWVVEIVPWARNKVQSNFKEKKLARRSIIGFVLLWDQVVGLLNVGMLFC